MTTYEINFVSNGNESTVKAKLNDTVYHFKVHSDKKTMLETLAKLIDQDKEKAKTVKEKKNLLCLYFGVMQLLDVE